MKTKRFGLQLWVENSTLTLALLGFGYLAVYALQVIFAKDKILADNLEVLSWVIWAIFAADLLVRLSLTKSFTQFIKSSWLEILALVVPFLRILRVFRVVLAIRGLKPFVKNRMSATGAYIALIIPLVWFAGAIAVLDAEKDVEGASIASIGDALWWSLVTITTVGYGDLYPKSIEGKFVAALLMLTGIALFSAGAGMFGSWIMKDKAEEKND